MIKLNEGKKEKKTDAAEVKEILGVVSKEIPALIKGVFSSLYSSEIAIEYGKGIGAVYKELKEQGIPEDMIKEIVLKYAKSINVLGDAINISDSIKKKNKDND